MFNLWTCLVFVCALSGTYAIPVDSIQQLGPAEREKVDKSFVAARAGIYDTRAHHSNGTNGQLSRQRDASFHSGFIQKIIAEASLRATPRQGVPPLMLFTAGTPGAGKSTIMTTLNSRGLLHLNQFLFVDTDEMRKGLPEYQSWTEQFKHDTVLAGQVSRATHRESKSISEELVRAAMRAGLNIIRDTTFRRPDFITSIDKDLTEFNYKVGIIHVDVTAEEALRRIRERAAQTGRSVSKEAIKDANPDTIKRTLDSIKSKVDFYARINNNNLKTVAVEQCWNKRSRSEAGNDLTTRIRAADWSTAFGSCSKLYFSPSKPSYSLKN